MAEIRIIDKDSNPKGRILSDASGLYFYRRRNGSRSEYEWTPGQWQTTWLIGQRPGRRKISRLGTKKSKKEVPTKNWQLPSASIRLSQCNRRPSTPTEKEFRVEIRNEALCVLWEKLVEQANRELYIFRSRFYEPNFCISLYLEKQKCVLDCLYPTSPKSHVYWPFPLPLGSSFSKAVSWAIVLILPPVKLNSQLSHCDFFPQLTEVYGWTYRNGHKG